MSVSFVWTAASEGLSWPPGEDAKPSLLQDGVEPVDG
jgi:hypothetical protein